MEEKLLGEFKSGVIFGELLVYGDRVEIKGLVSKRIIPASKITNVSVNKFFSRLSIETAGGEKILITGIRRKELEGAANLITSIGIANTSSKKISVDETKEKDTSSQQKVPEQKGESQNKNTSVIKKPWASMTKKEKLSVVGSIIVLLWFVGIFAVIISLFSKGIKGLNYPSVEQPTTIQPTAPPKPQQSQTQPSQPKPPTPTISLPKYEKIPYGIAQNSILVSPSTSIEQLKLLISELPKKLCSNPKVCLINIYSDAYAARTDVDLTDEFLDFAEKHFIGQYSSYGGSGGSPIRRYRVNGQWVNF